VRTARLELRLPSEDELVELAHLAEEGVHPADEMPFAFAWTDGVGQDGFVEGFVDFHLGRRRSWSAEEWGLELAVFADGVPMGFQSLNGTAFAADRLAVTGSWLGQRFQGRGYGTEMRAAVLELVFAGLGAEVAVSGHVEGNLSSMRVSEKLGYEPAGEGVVEPRGVPVRELKLELTRERWAKLPRIDVAIDGLGPCLPLFGLA
jgi:RimJ/RimL family protein N-acetyltransferase